MAKKSKNQAKEISIIVPKARERFFNDSRTMELLFQIKKTGLDAVLFDDSVYAQFPLSRKYCSKKGIIRCRIKDRKDLHEKIHSLLDSGKTRLAYIPDSDYDEVIEETARELSSSKIKTEVRQPYY